MAKGQAALEVKVGVFVFLLMALSVTVIFLLGRTSNLFAEQVNLRTAFKSASGLRVGAQVRLAGVQVGQVGSIHFGENPRDPSITVELKIGAEVLSRITTQSKARIDSMGLLGDKIIDISVGEKGEPVEANAMLPGLAPPEYLALLDTAKETLDDVRDTAKVARQVVGRYSDPKLHDDVAGILSGVRRVIDRVGESRGLLHAILFDKKLVGDVKRVLTTTRVNLDRFGQAGLALTRAFGEVGNMLKRMRNTKGSTLNALLYGKDQLTPLFGDLRGILAEAKRAAGGLGEMLAQVRDGKGLLQMLISEPRGREVMENLILASRSVKDLAKSLKEVGDGVKEGKGTVGALLQDPSLYEDLKATVGNLRRNRVLRALIRFGLQRRSEPSPAEAPTPAK